MDRQEKKKNEGGSENGSENGSPNDSDVEDKVSAFDCCWAVRKCYETSMMTI